MLHEIRSRAEWLAAKKESKCSPDLFYFNFSIRQQIEDNFPESPARLFVYQQHGKTKYWFMIKDNIYIDAWCFLAHSPSTSFSTSEFIECLREFRIRAFGSLHSSQPHLLIGKEQLVKIKQPLIPAGYEQSEILPYDEGELVNSTWKHAKEGDADQTIAKLARLPSACIRYQGQPVAFEMLDPSGFFNNQFVFEQHRRKGLGTAVELILAQKCVRRKMTPFKTIILSNTCVLEHTVKNPHWTRWEENGRPVTVIFQSWAAQ